MAPVEISKRNPHITVHPWNEHLATRAEQAPSNGPDATNDPISKLPADQQNEIYNFWHHYKREQTVASDFAAALAERDARQVVHNGENPIHLDAKPINVLPLSQEPKLNFPSRGESGQNYFQTVYKREGNSPVANRPEGNDVQVSAGVRDSPRIPIDTRDASMAPPTEEMPDLQSDSKNVALDTREVVHPGQSRKGWLRMPISTHYSPKYTPESRNGQTFGLQRKILNTRDESHGTPNFQYNQSLPNHGPLVFLAAIIAVFLLLSLAIQRRRA